MRTFSDINRFPDSLHLCSYAGLIPSTHSSGGITYHGSITKRGSKYLRWIMLECVHVHIRTKKIAIYHNSVQGWPKARAIPRQLLLQHQSY
jgi:transposase